ncbi:MAG: hypothetical protein H2184_01130 [Candidatus Galacturonibacter soehngenii]|nr:hypothetical protein [Candidatus Galacturonibacter soehngenii]
MRIRMKKGLLIILMALGISDIASIPVYAKDSVSCSGTFSYPTIRCKAIKKEKR